MAPVVRERRSQPVAAALLAALLAVTVSACASSSPTTPSATSSVAATSSAAASSSAAPPSAGASSPVPTIPSSALTPGAAGMTTLTGTVTEGVESGCIVLTDDTGAVLANLMGLDTTATPVGSTVKVTGEFKTDMMTTCQQGKPFSVTSAQVAG